MPLSLSVHNETGLFRDKRLPEMEPVRAGDLLFRWATLADDAAIREFLRGQAMSGGDTGMVRLAAETEPSFFGALKLLGERSDVLLAMVDGVMAGLGVRTMRRMWVGGEERVAAYLGLLRTAANVRRRREFLRTGYGMLGALAMRDPAAVTLTAILKENVAARRLLEAGHRSLPRYVPVAEIETYTVESKSNSSGGGATAEGEAEREEVAMFLRDTLRGKDGAPVIDADAFSRDDAGLLPWRDFVIVRQGGRMRACAAVWDQRALRQVMVCDYAGVLKHASLRLAISMWRRGRGLAPLPKAGKCLALGYISHLAMAELREGIFVQLMAGLRNLARKRGIDYLVLSLPRRHPLAPAARQMSMHMLESMLYQAVFPGAAAASFSDMPHVEAGLL